MFVRTLPTSGKLNGKLGDYGHCADHQFNAFKEGNQSVPYAFVVSV
jgi:hypothetical protein